MSRNILLIFMVISALFITQAKADFNYTTILPDVIASGIDRSFERQGNNLYDMSGNKSANSSFLPDMLVQSDQDILRNPWVQSQKDFNAFWYGFFYLMFILTGVSIAMIREVKSSAAKKIVHFTYRDNSLMSDEKFADMAVMGLLVYMFAMYAVDYILKIEWLLSKSVTYEIFEVMPPTPENGTGIFFMGGSAFILTGYMIYRYYIVYGTAGHILFMLGAWLLPYVKGIVSEILAYATLLLFSRFVLVLFALGGISLIHYLPFGLSLLPLPWLVLGGCLIFLSFAFVIGPVTFIRWAKRGIKSTIEVAIA